MAQPLKNFFKLFDKNTIRELQSIPEDIGVLAADEFDQNFKRGSFFNDPWEPSKRVKDNGGSTLQHTGDLRKSYEHEVNGNEIKFTSDRPDAEAHNEGATTRPHEIRAKRGRALKFNGVYRRKVNHPGSKIPKRQAVGHHPMLDDKIEEYLDKKMDGLFDK